MKALFFGLVSSIAFANSETGHLNLLHLPAGTEIKFHTNYKVYPNFVFQKLKDNCYVAFPKSTKYRRIKKGRTFVVNDLLRTFGATYKPDDLIMEHVVSLELREGRWVSPLKLICKDDTTINEFMGAVTRVASIKFPGPSEFEKPNMPELYTPPIPGEGYGVEKPGDHPYGGSIKHP